MEMEASTLGIMPQSAAGGKSPEDLYLLGDSVINSCH